MLKGTPRAVLTFSGNSLSNRPLNSMLNFSLLSLSIVPPIDQMQEKKNDPSIWARTSKSCTCSLNLLSRKSSIKQSKSEDPVTAKKFRQDLAEKWYDWEQLFTDGSKKDELTGCAFFHRNMNHCKLFRLPPECSVFTLELVAVKKALEYCLSYTTNNKFAIFTDCKSAVKKLEKLTPSPNVDIIGLIKKCKDSNKQIKIVWIRGHSNIIENETMDHLAKKAINDGELLANFKIPSSDMNALIKKKQKRVWQEYYTNKSNVYMRNNRVPSTDSCGTPETISCNCETEPFMFTN
nr:unnamed protein product [Callosobruchus chinensis]